MLMDTNNLVRDNKCSVLIHEQLLFVECCQNIQQIIDRLITLKSIVPYETNDVADAIPMTKVIGLYGVLW